MQVKLASRVTPFVFSSVIKEEEEEEPPEELKQDANR